MGSDQFAQSFLQLGTEKPPRMVRNCRASLGSLLRCLTALWQKEFFTCPVLALLFQAMPIASHSATMPHCEEPGSVFLTTFSSVLAGCC